MNHPTPVNDDLQRGRGWLNNAADVLSQAEDIMSSAEYARIAATLGAGFVALAHAERAAATSATLDAAAERVRRAAAEARPHDDGPTPVCEACKQAPPTLDGFCEPCITRCHDNDDAGHRCPVCRAYGPAQAARGEVLGG